MDNAEILKYLGRELTDIRNEFGLSTAALAERSGVPKSTISDIEFGRSARWCDVLRLSVALGVTLEELVPKNFSDNFSDS